MPSSLRMGAGGGTAADFFADVFVLDVFFLELLPPLDADLLFLAVDLDEVEALDCGVFRRGVGVFAMADNCEMNERTERAEAMD